MKKYMLFLPLILILFLSACAKHVSQNIAENTVIVYNNKDEKILETSDETILKHFVDYRGNPDDTELVTMTLGDVPKDSELAYRFLVKEEELDPLNFYVYSNNNYLKIDQIPFIGKLILELPEEDINWFRNPEKW